MSADDYRDAAAEHIETARLLHDAGRYAAAHYIAGLAVECLFRAYRRRLDPTFDARHDLAQLLIVSGFGDVVWTLSEEGRDALLAAFDCLFPGWRNSHRYLSEAGYRRFLKRDGFDRGVHGNYAKENSRRTVKAAAEIVEVGIRRWSR